MKENISASRIANSIRMTRGPSFSGAFLIVEGEADPKVYGHFIDENSCQIFSSHGKEDAIRVLEILESNNFTGVLAIIDADFWRLDGIEPNSPNLLITDTHDLETMILKSPALDSLLTEFGSPTKIKKLIQQLGKNIREILLDIALPIGYLRWISRKKDLSLDFKCRDNRNRDNRHKVFVKFIDYRKLTIDVAKMIAVFKQRSGKDELREEKLQQAMSRLANVKHDPWEICCGHDLVCILSLGLRRVLGTHNSNQVLPETIEKFLRVSYDTTYFFDTRLYKSLKAWEKANSPFRIFPNATV